MKIFRYIIILLGIALIIFNATKLNFDALLEGESQVALVGIAAAACAVMFMIILNLAYTIKKKKK